jgi:hypothetical protein
MSPGWSVIKLTAWRKRRRRIESAKYRLADGVVLRHSTSTKASDLRKNEPHPVSLLAPTGKLVNHLTENLVLSIEEASEVRIGHPTRVI